MDKLLFYKSKETSRMEQSLKSDQWLSLLFNEYILLFYITESSPTL